MQHKFNLIGINRHCVVFACAECDREFGFTTLDSFGVMAEELAEHECTLCLDEKVTIADVERHLEKSRGLYVF